MIELHLHENKICIMALKCKQNLLLNYNEFVETSIVKEINLKRISPISFKILNLLK